MTQSHLSASDEVAPEETAEVLELDAGPLVRKASWGTIVRLIGHGTSRLFVLLAVALIARHYGPAAFGDYVFALSFVALFLPLADLGLSVAMVRRFSDKAGVDLASAAGQMVGSKLVLALLSTVLVIASARASGVGLTPLLLIVIASVSLFAVVGDVFATILQVQHRQARIAAAEGFEQLCLLAFVGVAVATGQTLFMATAAYSVAALVRAALLFGFAAPFVVPSFAQGFRLPWKEIRAAAGIFLSGLFVVVYSEIDVLILGFMLGPEPVGHFSAAKRITRVWTLIPNALVVTVYPILYQLHRSQRSAAFSRMAAFGYAVAATVTVPIALGLAGVSGAAIHLVYGSGYTGAVAAMVPLSLSLIGAGTKSVTDYVLLASGKDRLLLTLNGCMLATVGLGNLLLVDRFGIAAPGWVLIAGFGVSFVGGLLVHDTRVHALALLRALTRPAIAGLAMVGLVWATRDWGVVAQVPVGVATYAAVLWMVGGLRAVRQPQ